MQVIQGQGLDEVLKEVKRLGGKKDPPPAGSPEPGAGRSASLAQGLLTGHLAGADASGRERASVGRRADFQSVRPSDGLEIRPAKESSAEAPPASSDPRT